MTAHRPSFVGHVAGGSVRALLVAAADTRTLKMTLGPVTVALIVAACAAASAPISPGASSHASSEPSAGNSPTLVRMALEEIVIAPDAPPDGMTLSDEGGGSAALGQLPLFPDTAAQLRAAPGLVDARWSRFAGSPSDFENSRGFILTWVVEFASEANAKDAVSILLNELQSEDHYGWGIGEDAGLGDEGTCLDGENPRLGGLPETICVWRRGPLVMVVGGGMRNETPLREDAAAMDARAAELFPHATPSITAEPGTSGDLLTIVLDKKDLEPGETIDSLDVGLEALLQPVALLENSRLRAQPGFVDARMIRIGTSGQDSYWQVGGFVSWAAVYASDGEAETAFRVLISEHESPNGWSMERLGPSPHGTQGVSLAGPAYGWDANRLYVWRHGSVILAAGALGVTATREEATQRWQAIANAMDSRATGR